MSLENTVCPQAVFASTGGALISPDTDFMNFVNLRSQNTSKAVQDSPNA